MNTHDKLQKLLNKPVREYRPGAFHKDLADVVICKDGATASIQASEYHYCTPRKNTGVYTEIEVWHVRNAVVTEFDYDAEEPSAYVPIEQVVQFIDNHGGIA